MTVAAESPSAPAPAFVPGPASVPASVPPLAARVRSVGGSPVRDILAVTGRPEVINFAGGLPAPELFDREGVAAAFRYALEEAPAQALQYATTEGEPSLREGLAARTTARGLPTTADDLLVTTGSQQALSLLATALLDPGDTVLVEAPCYLAALQVFGLAGARIVAVPGDEDGLDPEALADLVVRERPKLLYTVPTFQNPTGRTLPAERRAAVAAVAARHGLWIVEDDPYGELRYDGERVPWIAAHPDARDRTVLLGSFSKVMAPGIRLGWLRAAGRTAPGLRRRQAGRRPAHPDCQPARRGTVPDRLRPGRACGQGRRRVPGAPGRHARGPRGRPPGRVGVGPSRGRDVPLGPPPRVVRHHGPPPAGRRPGRGVRPRRPLLRR